MFTAEFRRHQRALMPLLAFKPMRLCSDQGRIRSAARIERAD